MNYVFVSVNGGVVDEVTFFQELQSAVDALREYVESMAIEDEDAAVYAPDGVVMTAKEILDEKKLSEKTEQSNASNTLVMTIILS